MLDLRWMMMIKYIHYMYQSSICIRYVPTLTPDHLTGVCYTEQKYSFYMEH